MSRLWLILCSIGLVGGLYLSYLLLDPTIHHAHGDIEKHYAQARAFVDGEVLYRDVAFEYPPATILAFSLPFLVPGAYDSVEVYFSSFVGVMSILCGIGLLVVAEVAMQLGLNRKHTVVQYLIFAVVLSPISLYRFDMFAMVMSMIGIWNFLQRRYVLAAIYLALGFWSKIYPGLFFGLGVLWIWREYRRLWGPEIWKFGLTFAFSSVLLAGPFWVRSGEAFYSFLAYHKDRDIQLESSYASALLLAEKIGFIQTDTIYTYQSFGIGHTWADVLRSLAPGLMLVIFGLSTWRVWRLKEGRSEVDWGRGYVRWSMIFCAIFIVTNKVFSPQFVIWLLPFAALLPLRLAPLSFGVFSFTTWLFPFAYDDLIGHHLRGVLVLVVRNVLLVWWLFCVASERCAKWWWKGLKKLSVWAMKLGQWWGQLDLFAKLGVLAVIGVYLWLRIGLWQSIEFGYDQPRTSLIIQDFMQTGTYFSAQKYSQETPWGNLSWGPALIFLHIPLFVLSSDPLILAIGMAIVNLLSVLILMGVTVKILNVRAAILAGLFLAVQPWWVIFSRMIYQPTLVPLCAIALFGCVVGLSRRRSNWMLLGAMLLSGVLVQLYLSSVSILVPIWLVLIFLIHRHRLYQTFVLGVLLLLLLFYPTLLLFRENPDSLTAFGKTVESFEPEQRSIVERIWYVTSTYFSVLSGGEMERQVGYAYEEFQLRIPGYELMTAMISVFLIVVLVYHVIALRKSELRLVRGLTIACATGVLWFFSFVGVEVLLPRYFLITLPFWSILIGWGIFEWSEMNRYLRITGVWLVNGTCLLMTLVIVQYHWLVMSFDYPRGFLSHFADIPYVYLRDAYDWIEEDAHQTGKESFTVSNDLDAIYEDKYSHAMLYMRDYVLKSQAEDGEQGHYLLVFAPSKPEEFYRFAQFGPYVVYKL